MNKQPFYHQAELEGEEAQIVNAIYGIRGVLKGSVDYVCGELLFTATRDVSVEANNALAKLKSENRINEITVWVNAEPGDPQDLM